MGHVLCAFVFEARFHHVAQIGLELTMYPRLIWNSWQSLCLHSWRLRLQTWATMPGPSLSFYSSHNHGVQCVQCEASPLRSPICCPLVQRARQSLWAILKGDKVTCSLIPLTAKTKELDRSLFYKSLPMLLPWVASQIKSPANEPGLRLPRLLHRCALVYWFQVKCRLA